MIVIFFIDRYSSLNAQFSSGYRRYTSWVPHYLMNRPRKFVTHCMEKIALASRISTANIREESAGIVQVKSAESFGTVSAGHTVQLNKNGMPSCQCYDWKQNFLPCKHMFAVILHMQNYSWEDIPAAYRDASYFTLDPHCAIKQNNTITDEPEVHININTASEANDDIAETNIKPTSCQVKDLPLPTSFTRKGVGSACRDILDQLKSLTFNVVDQNSLEELQKKLLELLKETRETTEKQDNLIVENDDTKVYKRPSSDHHRIQAGINAKRMKVCDNKQHIPLPSKKKQIQDQRVGSKADKQRSQRASYLNVNTGEIGMQTKLIADHIVFSQ